MRRAFAPFALLCGAAFGQAPEPVQPSFHTQTDLVTVPFQVRRGSRSVSDLKPSDVVLLEDGVPRGFTIFEAPPVHLTLDIVVMFDVTNPKTGGVGFWDTKALQDLANYWSEAIARRLLDERGATIRFSIYRFDQSKLQRLCQSTSDPKVLLEALRRLAGPATGQDVDIPLPAGLAVRTAARKAMADGRPPEPWSLAGALSVLRDSAAATSPRALVIFSTGAEGTSMTPENLGDEATAAGVPIYPVALLHFLGPPLPYDGYDPGFLIYSRNGDDFPRAMSGPGGLFRYHGFAIAPYVNYPFELLGDVTGGLHFETVSHYHPSDPDDPIPSGFVLSGPGADPAGFSMTGAETDDILERVKRHALARFSSTYTVGFVPLPSAEPREHKLEVKLAPKSSGKLTDGKRSAIY